MIQDKNIRKKIKDVLEDVKLKRELFPSGSEEKKEYRKISKKLDNILKDIDK